MHKFKLKYIKIFLSKIDLYSLILFFKNFDNKTSDKKIYTNILHGNLL